jgi:uncharacterized protein (TIGR03503 family)
VVRHIVVLIALSWCIPVWADQPPVPDLRLLIDVSGSMKKNDPQNLRAPAIRLLVGMLPENAQAGIWTFGQRVTPTAAVAKVDQKWRRKARATVSKIRSNEMFTDIEQVLSKATADWVEPDSRFRRSVILLTDGLVDISKISHQNEASRRRILDEVLPRIEAVGANIHTIALSSASDHELMEKLSAKTGGWYEQVDSADTLDRLFLRLFEQSTTPDTLPLKDNRFTVDENIKDMTVLVFRDEMGEPVNIVAPDAETYSAQNHPKKVKWMSEIAYDLVSVERPAAGEWQIDAPQDPDNRVTVVTNLRLEVAEPIPAHFLASDAPAVQARLRYELMGEKRPEFLDWVKFTLQRQVKETDAKTTIVLQDQGDPPDFQSGDEVYSAFLGPALEAGFHELIITANGGSFSRQYRQWVRVHDHAVEVDIQPVKDNPEMGGHTLSIHAEPALLRTEGLQVQLQIEGEDTNISSASRVNDDEWRMDLPPRLNGRMVEISINGEDREGNPFLFSRSLHVSTEPLGRPLETETKEPAMITAQESDALSTEQGPGGVDWGVIGILTLVENLALGLIGWLGYRLWKKRQTGKQEKSKKKISASSADVLESSVADELDGSKQARVHDNDVESMQDKEAEIDTSIDEPQPDNLQGDMGSSETETEADVLNAHEDVVIEESDIEESEIVNLDEIPSGIDFNADLAEPVVATVDTVSSGSAQPVDSADSDSEYEFPEQGNEGTDELLDELNAMLDNSDEELATEADPTSTEDVNAQEQVIEADDKEQTQQDNEPRKVS